MSEQHEEIVDPRTATEKAVDEVIGAKGLTELDRQFGKVLKHANDLFISGKRTREYLLLGEEAHAYVLMAVEKGFKRSDATARLTDRLADAGMAGQDIRVNDWMGVFGLATLVTGESTVKAMDKGWIGTHAYRTLAILKVAIERDDTTYTFKPHWSDFVQTCLRDGVRGAALEQAVKQHAKAVEDHVRTTRMNSLTPDKQHQAEMAELSKERDKKVNAINKAAESVRDKAVEIGLSPEDLLTTFVSRGIIQAPEPIKVPLEPQDYARNMDADQAVAFATALIERGNTAIVMQVASILSGWLRGHSEKAAG